MMNRDCAPCSGTVSRNRGDLPTDGAVGQWVQGPDTAQGAARVCRWRTQYLLTHPVNRDRRQGWMP